MYVKVADDEIPAIVRLMNSAYRGAGGVSGWCTEQSYIAGDRTTSDHLRADIIAKPSASLLKWVEADTGLLVGCVWLEPLDDDTWYLGSLAVDPERQNGAVGRTMLDAAEDWLRQRGAKHVRITVINVRDSLIAWYIRRGYAATGKTDPFPYGDDRFGRPLREDLCFVILEKNL
jgi:ribosomal protein S18 acetylase RimI-like enzyme